MQLLKSANNMFHTFAEATNEENEEYRLHFDDNSIQTQ